MHANKLLFYCKVYVGIIKHTENFQLIVVHSKSVSAIFSLPSYILHINIFNSLASVLCVHSSNSMTSCFSPSSANKRIDYHVTLLLVYRPSTPPSVDDDDDSLG